MFDGYGGALITKPIHQRSHDPTIYLDTRHVGFLNKLLEILHMNFLTQVSMELRRQIVIISPDRGSPLVVLMLKHPARSARVHFALG